MWPVGHLLSSNCNFVLPCSPCGDWHLVSTQCPFVDCHKGTGGQSKFLPHSWWRWIRLQPSEVTDSFLSCPDLCTINSTTDTHIISLDLSAMQRSSFHTVRYALTVPECVLYPQLDFMIYDSPTIPRPTPPKDSLESQLIDQWWHFQLKPDPLYLSLGHTLKLTNPHLTTILR